MIFSDFYAGAGGWSLGLTLAGHKASMSAEIWPTANTTRAFNLGTQEAAIDIRRLDPLEVPDSRIIVGSPPCTQFSYANKGGNGDITDGLVDIRSFLRIIEVKKPEFWVMENVPRVSGILRELLAPGGELNEFAHLFDSIDDFDMSHWGVPQRRRRCIAGRYPREALMALRGRRAPTLAQVLEGCRTGVDAVWGTTVDVVSDRDPGNSLRWEEARINEEKKNNHPIYNDMAFPDHQDRPSRTVTATCTKVSRESIVVPDGDGGYRLLSIRETAALQSFPLSYQFASKGRSDRIKMAGNAIPPLFTYAMGLAIDGKSFPEELPSFHAVGGIVADAPMEKTERRAPKVDRPFKAAIRALRFKSAMAFELRNTAGRWEVIFHTGGVGSWVLAADLIAHAARPLGWRWPHWNMFNAQEAMTLAWVTSTDCEHHPFRVADALGAISQKVIIGRPEAEHVVRTVYLMCGSEPSAKALANAPRIAAGIVLAAQFNKTIKQERIAA